MRALCLGNAPRDRCPDDEARILDRERASTWCALRQARTSFESGENLLRSVVGFVLGCGVILRPGPLEVSLP